MAAFSGAGLRIRGLSFEDMPLANDADSAVRGGCSVRVSAGAGYFGVVCPVTTIRTLFETTSERRPAKSAASTTPSPRSRLQFAFLAAGFNPTGFSLSCQSWDHVEFSKQVRKLYYQ